jgi:hypothetical protein
MRAIVLSGFCGLESLVIKELPDPEPKAGRVLIAVKAFGVNHAETHMRKGEWAEAAEVSGIECVGEVVAAPGGEFRPGDKVAAFMGGMGRTIPLPAHPFEPFRCHRPCKRIPHEGSMVPGVFRPMARSGNAHVPSPPVGASVRQRLSGSRTSAHRTLFALQWVVPSIESDGSRRVLLGLLAVAGDRNAEKHLTL